MEIYVNGDDKNKNNNTVFIVMKDNYNSEEMKICVNLEQLQEIQGVLAIAAAKLRGKLAKEATSQ